jgi:glycerol-3-phosphate dehydrogenase (NAD(P)+)
MTTTPDTTVCILGLGQMGLCCASILLSPDHPGPAPRLGLWGHDETEVGTLAQARTSDRLPGFTLPESARVSLSDSKALESADLIVNAIPVQFIRQTWGRLAKSVPANAGIVSVSKGLENTTLLRPTQIIAEVLADNPDTAPRPLAALSGPTIATELAKGLPATVTVASDNEAFAVVVQQLFNASFLRVYTNPDLLGVELAGATKNVIAIAAGIIDGLAAGNNAKSALLARGLAEITRLGTAMGANSQTFYGVSGVGDLATTCFSPEGRNRSCGEALGRGEKLESYLAHSPFVVEGVATTSSVVDLARKFKVDMPITQAVHRVLFEGLDPVDAIGLLMSRELKDEIAD